jgi:hypothetical protein
MVVCEICNNFYQVKGEDVWDECTHHFFIHSVDSIACLIKPTGFQLEGIIYDSTAKQFHNSELYQNGIPLIQKKPMSKKMSAVLSRKAAIANKLSKGDQAIYS